MVVCVQIVYDFLSQCNYNGNSVFMDLHYTFYILNWPLASFSLDVFGTPDLSIKLIYMPDLL